jgi:hypothetical protein
MRILTLTLKNFRSLEATVLEPWRKWIIRLTR